MSQTHKYVGTHPYDFDGRPLAPGEEFTPSKEQLDHYSFQDLVSNNQVLELSKKAVNTPNVTPGN